MSMDGHWYLKIISALTDKTNAYVTLAAKATGLFQKRFGVAEERLATDTDLADYQLLSEKAAANGYAGLDAGGKVPVAQLPVTVFERLVVVADQTARFALTTATVQNGDTVKQNDTGALYYVVDDTNLGNAAGYEIYTATIAWGAIVGTLSNQTDLQNALNAKKSIATGNNYKFVTTGATGDLQETTVTASRIVITDANGLPVGADTATYPSLAELAYVKGVTSAIQTQIAARLIAASNLSDLANAGTSRINLGTIFTLVGSPNVFNPADSTTYYIPQSFTSPTTAEAAMDFNAGFAFRIIGVMLNVVNATTAGSAENVTLQIRNVTQATSSSVGTFTADSTAATESKTFSYTGLSINVAAGDNIAIQVDCPAWATNPVGTRISWTLFCIKT